MILSHYVLSHIAASITSKWNWILTFTQNTHNTHNTSGPFLGLYVRFGTRALRIWPPHLPKASHAKRLIKGARAREVECEKNKLISWLKVRSCCGHFTNVWLNLIIMDMDNSPLLKPISGVLRCRLVEQKVPFPSFQLLRWWVCKKFKWNFNEYQKIPIPQKCTRNQATSQYAYIHVCLYYIGIYMYCIYTCIDR